MTRFAFASVKASPGVTTLLQALALSWPGDRAVLVVEADPAGGDLAARLELPAVPGLVSLAAAGRRGLSGAVVLEHAQDVSERAGLLVGPPSSRQARAALDLLGERLVSAMDDVAGMDILIDCGRLDAASSAAALARAAELVVLVARPTVAEVAHLAPRVEEMRGDGCRVVLVLVGEPGPGSRHLYPADEVAASVGVPVLATVADDPRTAAVLAGHRRGERVLARSELLRSARQLAASLIAATAAKPHADGELGELAPIRVTASTLASSGNGGTP